jgi:hypothetical protein
MSDHQAETQAPAAAGDGFVRNRKPWTRLRNS